MTSSVIYQAEVSTTSSTKVYTGSTESAWKTRFNNHQSSLRLRHLGAATTLSSYVWQLKDSDTDYRIRWKIVKSVPGYTKETKKCQLCLAEKTLILYSDKRHQINKRNEIMNKCRHRAKHKLQSYL